MKQLAPAADGGQQGTPQRASPPGERHGGHQQVKQENAMTVMIGVDIHFKPADVRHRYYPGDDKCHAYGVLKIDNGSSTYANLYFDTDPAHIDKMIAELVALKQEMDPPVVPPCGKCHYPLDSPGHDEMCEQRAAFLAAPSGMQDPAPAARITDVKAPASLVGMVVEDAHDDSPVPATGTIVRQVDAETVEVQWGTSSAMREPIDALRPARQQPASVAL